MLILYFITFPLYFSNTSILFLNLKFRFSTSNFMSVMYYKNWIAYYVKTNTCLALAIILISKKYCLPTVDVNTRLQIFPSVNTTTLFLLLYIFYLLIILSYKTPALIIKGSGRSLLHNGCCFLKTFCFQMHFIEI